MSRVVTHEVEAIGLQSSSSERRPSSVGLASVVVCTRLYGMHVTDCLSFACGCRNRVHRTLEVGPLSSWDP